MNSHKQAINCYCNHLMVAVFVAVSGILLSDIAGLQKLNGPSVVSIVIAAMTVAATGFTIFRGVVTSKSIANSTKD